jgi:hypothetical protein
LLPGALYSAGPVATEGEIAQGWTAGHREIDPAAHPLSSTEDRGHSTGDRKAIHRRIAEDTATGDDRIGIVILIAQRKIYVITRVSLINVTAENGDIALPVALAAFTFITRKAP